MTDVKAFIVSKLDGTKVLECKVDAGDSTDVSSALSIPFLPPSRSGRRAALTHCPERASGAAVPRRSAARATPHAAPRHSVREPVREEREPRAPRAVPAAPRAVDACSLSLVQHFGVRL